MNPLAYVVEKIKAFADWTNRAPWAEYFSNLFYILFALIFILTVIGNGISGGFENSPYP